MAIRIGTLDIASERLRVSDRENIVKRLLCHAFETQVIAHGKARHDYALRVYRDIFSEADIDRMYSLPPGWLNTLDEVRARIAGNDVTLHFGSTWDLGAELRKCLSDVDVLKNNVKMPYPYNMVNKINKVYEATHALADAYEDLSREHTRLHDLIITARKKAEAVVNSYTTVNALIKAWPDVEPFIAPSKPITSFPVPAIPITELNSLFALPVEEEEA